MRGQRETVPTVPVEEHAESEECRHESGSGTRVFCAEGDAKTETHHGVAECKGRLDKGDAPTAAKPYVCPARGKPHLIGQNVHG
jgi:hypothetical protein